jgi:hypothetical protein
MSLQTAPQGAASRPFEHGLTPLFIWTAAMAAVATAAILLSEASASDQFESLPAPSAVTPPAGPVDDPAPGPDTPASVKVDWSGVEPSPDPSPASIAAYGD